jgi:methionine synthase I (cobalamin-dependent)
MHYGDGELSAIVTAGIRLAIEARDEVSREDGRGEERFVALDIGPLGALLEPYGAIPFETAVDYFARIVRIGVEAGADLVLIETMTDAYETKAAVLAAKENCTLPVFVTNTYDGTGKLMTGASPEAMVALLEGLGVDALGLNCSTGPAAMLPVVKRLCDAASVPVIVNPNAGLPRVDEAGKTVYDLTPDVVGDDENVEYVRVHATASETKADQKSLYNYRKFVFDGVDFNTPEKPILTVFMDVYYLEDVNYEEDPYGTLPVYQYVYENQPYTLTDRDIKALEAYE